VVAFQTRNPLHPEIRLDTTTHTLEANAHLILDCLAQRGFIRSFSSRCREERVATRRIH
jgi:adenylylsulfate kinase-like enzyme